MRIVEGTHLTASGTFGISLIDPADCNDYTGRCGEAGYVLIDIGACIAFYREIDSVILGAPDYAGCLGAPGLAPTGDALLAERVPGPLESLKTGTEVRLAP